MKGQVKVEDLTKMLKEEDYKRVSEFEKNFKFKKNLQKEPRFGNCSIIQNPRTNQLIVVKENRANDKKEAARLILNARKLKENKHPNILNLLDYSVVKHSELCSSFFIIKYFYDYPKSDLDRELKLRGRNQEGFSDVELTHLLYQQMHANEYLESQKMHHGDVRPINVAYDPTNMQCKLIDQSDSETSARLSKELQRNKLQSGLTLYQSPDMFKNLSKKNLNFSVDPNKEDVFATGLTILEAGNGKSIQDIYDKKKGEIDQVALDKHLQEFRAKHGQDNTLLSSSLESMLAVDEAERPNFTELKNNMPAYDEIKPFLDERLQNPNQTQYNNHDTFEATPFKQTQVKEVKNAPPPVYEYENSNNFSNTTYTNYTDNNTTNVEIPLMNIPKKTTIVHSEAPKFEKQEPVLIQNVQVSKEPSYNYNYTPPQNNYGNNYVSEIKHEIRRGNQVFEPEVIRENRASYMPTETYRESNNVYTQPINQVVYNQPTNVVYTQPRTSQVVYSQPTNVYTQQSNVVYTQPRTSQVVYSQPTNVVYNQPSNILYTQQEPVIRRSVNINDYESTYKETSGLRLINTYEDPTNAR